MAKNKKILIHNKFYKFDRKVSKDYCKSKNVVKTPDYLYAIIDQVLVSHVKVKNYFFNFFFNYWFYNNDFRKQKSLSTRSANKARLLINIIFWLSVLGLTLCLIFGVAIPVLKSAFDTYKLFNGNFSGSLVSNGKIIGWVVTDSNLYSVISNILKTLKDNQSNLDTFLAANDNLWLKYYLTEYWLPYQNIFSTAGEYTSAQLAEGVKTLIEHLNMNLVTNFNYVYLTTPIQTLTYFSLVNGSLTTTSFTQAELIQIFSSWHHNHFTALPHSNIFYGLKSTRIALSNNQATQTLLIPDVWAAWFANASVIVPMCLTLVFFAIIVFHYRTVKKNKPKFTSMSMYDYVSTKIRATKKWQFLLKKMVFLSKDIDSLKHNFVFGFDKLDSTTIYNTIRLLNYSYSSIESMSIVLVADYDETLLNQYESVIKNETNNLAITIVDADDLEVIENPKSKISKKSIFVNNISSEEMVYQQYYYYLVNCLDYINQNNNFLIFKNELSKLSKFSKKNHLTVEEQTRLINEVYKENAYDLSKNELINKAIINLKFVNGNINYLLNKLIKKYDQSKTSDK